MQLDENGDFVYSYNGYLLCTPVLYLPSVVLTTLGT